MTYNNIIRKIKALSNPRAVEGMARFGINPQKNYGVSIPALRKLAKEIGPNHSLALQLFKTGIHDARILASMVDIPAQVTEKQMETWVKEFDSWDVCDQCCNNLFDKTGLAFQKAFQWSESSQEFVKRAGFVLMATLSVHDKKATNKQFEQFFPVIIKHASDKRNFVKKAVNWALRQIGKRNAPLNRKAIETAKKIQKIDSKAAKWIATDAIRELTHEKVQKRIKSR